MLLAGLGISNRFQHFRFIAVVVGFSMLLELALYRLFPGSGRFPFGPWNLVPAVMFCLFGIAITRDVPKARPLRGIFWIYLAACLVAYVVPSALGSNVERLRYAALPIVLLAVSLRRWRPARLMITGVALAAVWNVTPLASSFAQAASDPAGTPVYWASTVTFLHSHLSPSFRVEAVDTVDHWPAEYLPDARHSDRAGLVPPGGLPGERAAVRPQALRPRRTGPGCAGSASATSSSPTHRLTTARGSRRS